MKLTAKQIFDLSLGAMTYEEKGGAVELCRFNEAQQALYMEAAATGGRCGMTMIPGKIHCPAGIELRFRTDSPSLELDVEVKKGTGRTFFAIQVLVNGVSVGAIENHTAVQVPPVYSHLPFQQGNFRKSFDLGAGEKEVRVLLPWSSRVLLHGVILADGAALEAVKPAKKLLVYGDSITQGYDALWPSNCYPFQLADALGAEQHNRAIGGEIFFPELLEADSLEAPDYITVAYGTNDWVKCTEAETRAACRAFYLTASRKYPNARIFAITPIWRQAWQQPGKGFGPWALSEQIIRESTADLPNVTVIDGLTLVPHEEACFADDMVLHPNDAGFGHYGKNLAEAVKKAL